MMVSFRGNLQLSKIYLFFALVVERFMEVLVLTGAKVVSAVVLVLL